MIGKKELKLYMTRAEVDTLTNFFLEASSLGVDDEDFGLVLNAIWHEEFEEPNTGIKIIVED